ncbi:MAG: hypothetical protein Q7W13_04935 [Bacteroidia bacterium]|nr:hypothetical protein [Bacteroidia bacterium]
MKTIKDNELLTESEKLKTIKLAKGGTWYNDWKPYCLNCSCNLRMQQKPYGFICSSCKDIIGWDLTRLQESPINFQIVTENQGFSGN